LLGDPLANLFDPQQHGELQNCSSHNLLFLGHMKRQQQQCQLSTNSPPTQQQHDQKMKATACWSRIASCRGSLVADTTAQSVEASH